MSKKIIAVCGKGGVGKTAFTTMLSSALAGSAGVGNLLLIDADPALGLTNAVGVKVKKTLGEVREAIIREASGDAALAKSEVSQKIDYMILESLTEAESLSVLAMGRSDSLGCYCSVNGVLREAVDVLAQKFDTILIDGEAGVEQINRQVMRRVNDLIILSDASRRGLQTVECILNMVKRERGLHCDRVGVVFNRAQGELSDWEERLRPLDVPLLGVIPDDEMVRRYDFEGRPLVQLPDDAPSMKAVRAIAARLFAE